MVHRTKSSRANSPIRCRQGVSTAGSFRSTREWDGPTKAEERRGLQATEKVLVICSVAGLASPGILREIDETAGEDPKRLLAVLRDKDWLSGASVVARDGQDLKQHLLNNVWVDFSVGEFDDCFEKLLDGLAKTSPGRPSSEVDEGPVG